MSMYQIEDFVEAAVKAVAASGLDPKQKRNIIYTLFEMEECGDCSFTNLRTIQEMIGCGYSFAFAPEQMYNYKSHPELYAEDQPTSYEGGDIYYDPNTGKYCVDSGSEAWERMVEIKAISGIGATPVEYLAYKEVLRELKALMAPMDRYTQLGFEMLAMVTFAIDDMNEQECLEIMGKTQDQMEEGNDEEFKSPTSPRSYEIAGVPVVFRMVVDITPEQWTIHGYKTECRVVLYEKEVPLECKILLTEPAVCPFAQFKDMMSPTLSNEEVLNSTIPQPPLDNFVAQVNNYLSAFNASPRNLQYMTELLGVKHSSSEIHVENIEAVIQMQTNGLRLDMYFRIRLEDGKCYQLRSGSVPEVNEI